jgi:hypothetical protein
MPDDNAKLRQKIPGQPLSKVTWAYVCGVFTLGSTMFGLVVSFIPVAFGVIGAILSWQLLKTEDRRHGSYAGVLNLGALIVWLMRAVPILRHMFHV